MAKLMIGKIIMPKSATNKTIMEKINIIKINMKK
jgi:hypothetical protein